MKTEKSRFSVGERVLSTIDGQGLVDGVLYEVVDVKVRSTPFGGFATYFVRCLDRTVGEANPDGTAKVFPVGNGHLVLEPASAPAPRVARIDYTTEHPRRGATRRTREVRASEEKLPAAVERALKKISDAGGYNAVVRYEVAS